MTTSTSNGDFLQPSSLQEALNIIKFLKTTHKQEVVKLKEANKKQMEFIKKLEATRKKELEYLSGQLHDYEVSLAIRSESVAKQLAEKDKLIKIQVEKLEELRKQLKSQDFVVPDIVLGDSNSDSGIAMENEESHTKTEEVKTDGKTMRKCSRRFAESISFLRRVDFSPMKYKPRETKKKDEKNNLDVPRVENRVLHNSRFYRSNKAIDDERIAREESVHSDNPEPIMIRPKSMNDSMNNRFSDDGSEDTSEEVFDRVMTRSSIRRSVKANPKYKKINRTKSKLLEHIKVNIVD